MDKPLAIYLLVSHPASPARVSSNSSRLSPSCRSPYSSATWQPGLRIVATQTAAYRSGRCLLECRSASRLRAPGSHNRHNSSIGLRQELTTASHSAILDLAAESSPPLGRNELSQLNQLPGSQADGSWCTANKLLLDFRAWRPAYLLPIAPAAKISPQCLVDVKTSQDTNVESWILRPTKAY